MKIKWQTLWFYFSTFSFPSCIHHVSLFSTLPFIRLTICSCISSNCYVKSLLVLGLFLLSFIKQKYFSSHNFIIMKLAFFVNSMRLSLFFFFFFFLNAHKAKDMNSKQNSLQLIPHPVFFNKVKRFVFIIRPICHFANNFNNNY